MLVFNWLQPLPCKHCLNHLVPVQSCSCPKASIVVLKLVKPLALHARPTVQSSSKPHAVTSGADCPTSAEAPSPARSSGEVLLCILTDQPLNRVHLIRCSSPVWIIHVPRTCQSVACRRNHVCDATYECSDEQCPPHRRRRYSNEILSSRLSAAHELETVRGCCRLL